jgi:hypothetical protein
MYSCRILISYHFRQPLLRRENCPAHRLSRSDLRSDDNDDDDDDEAQPPRLAQCGNVVRDSIRIPYVVACVRARVSVRVSVSDCQSVCVLTPEIFCYSVTHGTQHQCTSTA